MRYWNTERSIIRIIGAGIREESGKRSLFLKIRFFIPEFFLREKRVSFSFICLVEKLIYDELGVVVVARFPTN